MILNREVAWRVFASEFNASVHEIKGNDERATSYLLSPLGAKINRVFVVGVLTDKENVGEKTSPLWRASIMDPAGNFTISAGQYQPDATLALSMIEPPKFVAIVGKTRVYRPADKKDKIDNYDRDIAFVSIRPEIVKVVDSAVRDYWIYETCRLTLKRIEAMNLAIRMGNPTIEELVEKGVSRSLAEGVVESLNVYKSVDVERYTDICENALRKLIPTTDAEIELEMYRREEIVSDEDEKTNGNEEKENEEEIDKEIKQKVMAIIKELETENTSGAEYSKLSKRAKQEGIDGDTLEGTINELMDDGLIYEPKNGFYKSVE